MPILTSVITYFALGLNDSSWTKFGIFLLTAILTYNACTGFGYVLGTSVSDKNVAVILTTLVVVPMMLFAGFFVNQKQMIALIRPIAHISIFRYGYQAMVINEFTDADLDCAKETNPIKSCDPLGDFDSPDTLEYSLGAMGVFWVGCYGISFFILKSLSRKYE